MVSRRPATILMKEIFRHCALYRIDWGKLFFAGAIMTIAGVMLQMFTLPYPLSQWFLSPPLTVSSDEPINGAMELISERVNESRVQQFQLVAAGPNVLLNSPVESNFLVPVELERSIVSPQTRKSVSRRRRKSIKVDSKPNNITPPPPPPSSSVPYHLQVYKSRILTTYCVCVGLCVYLRV